MAVKKNTQTARPNGQLVTATGEQTPAEGPSAAELFLNDRKEGKVELIDPPADLGTPPDEEPVAETPAADAPVAEEPAADAPAVEEPPVVEGAKVEPAAEPAPAAKPVADGATPADAAAPVAAAAPAKPAEKIYDPNEKFDLAPGHEWTRDQIVTRISEYQALQPKIADYDEFQATFKMDGKTAKERWTPILQKLADPEKLRVMESLLDADPDRLAYIDRAMVHYDTVLSEADGREGKPVEAKPVDIMADPRVKEMSAYIHRQKLLEGERRGKEEWRDAFTAFPFLQTDAVARQALIEYASALYNADRAAGKDDLECRGIAAAVEANKANFEARMIVIRQQTANETPKPTPAADGAAALLGSQGATPTPGRAKQTGVYNGDPADAVSAFLKDTKG